MQEQLKSVADQVIHAADQIVHAADQVVHAADQVDLAIRNFNEIVESIKQEANSQKLERQEMPPKPSIFYGRDRLVEKTSKLLSSSETALHLCLLGPGGIGKTSLALAIIESPLVQAKFQEGHRVWVPCIEATSASLFLQVLYTSLQVKRQTDSVMSDILDELTSSKDPCLLLLDNFETPWNVTDSDGQKRVEETLHKLNRLSHLSILITMRGSHTPTVDVEWYSVVVPATDKDASLQIFQRFNPHWNMDPNLDGLLDAVGCMPFAITLMASHGRESGSSPKQLLEEWLQLGTDMWSADGSLESGMNKSIRLSLDSDFVKSNPDAIDLLAALSLLPAGTTREHLAHWVPNLKSMSAAIITLSRAALLQTTTRDGDHTSQTLFVLPVLQSFMLHHNRIPERIQQGVRSAFCNYVLDHACRYWDSMFETKAKTLAREDANIQSILVGATDCTGSDDQLVRALLAFSWYRLDTKPLITAAEHTLKVAKASGNDRYIAEALLCLGGSYAQVSKYIEAKGVLEESPQILAADHSSQSQQLDFECALIRIYVGSHLRSDWRERKAMVDDVLSRTKESNVYWHARALKAVGWLFCESGNMEQALEAFVESADMMKGLGCNRDRASTLYGKAESLNYLYVPDEVVYETLQEAWEIARHLEPLGDHSAIYILLGHVFIRMGRPVDAMNAFEKSLGVSQYIGGGLGIADALESIGYVYLHTVAYWDAYSAFETAVEAYAGLGEKSPDGKVFGSRCRENMARIKLKQENPNQRIGFYRPRCTREWRDLFYPAATSYPYS